MTDETQPRNVTPAELLLLERQRELEEAVVALRVALKPFGTAFLLLPEDMPRNLTVAKHVYEVTAQVCTAERIEQQATALEWASQIPVSETPAGQVRAFAAYILHGDEHHRAWLLAAAEAFIADEPLPAHRSPDRNINEPPAPTTFGGTTCE